jgi:quercetin dioxygenase-like cupin family protein
MNGYYVEFEPVPDTVVRPHDHTGVELIFVVEGRLGVRIAGSETVLGRGDAIYFDASQPHSYRKVGGRTCAAIVVTA